MTPPPPPGHGTGPEPGRDSGLPGGHGGPGRGNTGGRGSRGGGGTGPGGGHGSGRGTGGPGGTGGSSGGGRGGSGGRPGSPGGPDVPGGGPGGPGGSGRPVSAVPVGGRDPRLAMFAQHDAGDRFPPNGWLAMMLDELSGPDRTCPDASDEELLGIAGRWQALGSWAAAGKLGVLGEVARRRALPGHENARPAGLPGAFDEGTGHEVSAALAVSLPGADKLVHLACTLLARLPGTYRLLAGGVIDELKARLIADELAVLDDDLAAQAEALIGDQLAGKTPGQVVKLAAAAVVAVDPAGAVRRREQAQKDDARVRLWREQSGTAALAGYGLPTDAALAANANIAARARQYKRARVDGTMDQLRVLAFMDILNGVPAHQRIAQARAEAAAQSQGQGQAQDSGGNGQPGDSGPRDGGASGDDHNGDGAADGNGSGDDSGSGDDTDTGDDCDSRQDSDFGDDTVSRECGGSGNGSGPRGASHSGDGSAPAGGQAGGAGGDAHAAVQPGDAGPALAASTNLTLPLATILGLADRPGHGHGLGPLDPALVRDLANTAARSPHSTWCVTIVGPSGYAIGHGCARPVRSKRGKPPPGRDRGSPWGFTRRSEPGPPGGWGTWTLTLPGGRDYTVKLGPVPVTDCDHRYESSGYQPGDMLRHLVQVRDGECTFPSCSRHARDTDFEHAVPYERGGRTCGCNAGARSRRCHRVKQGKGWKVTQPLPGWHQWETPSGRTYVQEPMKYPA